MTLEAELMGRAKRSMRERVLTRRSKLPAEARARAATAIAETGLNFIDLTPGCVVAGYAAIRGELDPRSLIERLSNAGHPIALPVVVARDAPLEFRLWQPGQPLERGAFGVPIPGEWATKIVPDVLLVPLAAFDREGYRLGYGGGYYDRTLAVLRESRPVTAVGLAYDEQEVVSVPQEETDQPLDWVLTPSGPIRVQGVA
jgi:5-formyltetrahydrofolate cyclo-ligase